MLRTPARRAVAIAVLATALAALLVGGAVWTPPLARSTAPVAVLDDLLTALFWDEGAFRGRPRAAWTQWYLYGVSALGAVVAGVQVCRHWRVDRDELALVPVRRGATTGGALAGSPGTDVGSRATSAVEWRARSASSAEPSGSTNREADSPADSTTAPPDDPRR